MNILDKKTGREFDNQLVFEDTGDIGNEYIYRQSADKKTIFSTDSTAEVKVLQNNFLGAKVQLQQTMMVPESADERLEYERQAVIDITNRKANRSEKLVPLTLTTVITLSKNADQLKFKTSFNNQMKDHRVRVLFKTNLKSNYNLADSIFETVKRPNHVSDTWKNPTNPQHQQTFVNVCDDNGGMTVGNFGLNEYEILPEDNTIAVTLLRCVGEMGDWGYFGTPDAQCLGQFSFEYSLAFHDNTIASRTHTYQQAKTNQVSVQSVQTDIHNGIKKCDTTFLTLKADSFAVTSLKQAETSDGNILRGYNLTNNETKIDSSILKQAKTVNFLEEDYPVAKLNILNPAEIRTYKFSF